MNSWYLFKELQSLFGKMMHHFSGFGPSRWPVNHFSEQSFQWVQKNLPASRDNKSFQWEESQQRLHFRDKKDTFLLREITVTTYGTRCTQTVVIARKSDMLDHRNTSHTKAMLQHVLRTTNPECPLVCSHCLRLEFLAWGAPVAQRPGRFRPRRKCVECIPVGTGRAPRLAHRSK